MAEEYPPPRKRSRFSPDAEAKDGIDNHNNAEPTTSFNLPHVSDGGEDTIAPSPGPAVLNHNPSLKIPKIIIQNNPVDNNNPKRPDPSSSSLSTTAKPTSNPIDETEAESKLKRKQRRQGIYGLESLLSPNTVDNALASASGSASASTSQNAIANACENRRIYELLSPKKAPGQSSSVGPKNGENIDDDNEEIEEEKQAREEKEWVKSIRRIDPDGRLILNPSIRTIDLDRDAMGRLKPPNPSSSSVPRTIMNLPSRGISNLPLHATANPSLGRRMLLDSLNLNGNNKVGDDTSLKTPVSQPPQHLQASEATLINKPNHIRGRHQLIPKRKRPSANLPAPPFTHRRTNKPDFNIFTAILSYPELCFHFSARLPIKDLISLYAISKDYHHIIETRFTTVILSQALRKAPESARAFPFRSYAHLCRQDPAARIPHPDPRRAARGVVRLVPSFKWLHMIMHREKVVQEIMALFAEHGVPLPARCALAIKRMWFILDIPDNARRIGFAHSRLLFTDMDLYFATCFFVKLDMVCNDPVGYIKADGLKKMLLSQPTFTVLVRVLKRELWVKKIDLLRAWVCYKYEPAPHEMGSVIFGIPAKFAGRLRYEYWGRLDKHTLKREPLLLLRPDQLVMREIVRRKLKLSGHYLRCLMYGYVRPDTLKSYAPRTYGRRVAAWENEEYGVDDMIGGVNALAIKDGGDELLDLGEVRQGSVLTIVPEKVSQEEIHMRKTYDDLLEQCRKESEAEREAMGI